MIKTIPGRFVNGEWVEQQHIEMGPFEEAAMNAQWAWGEKDAQRPVELTADQKIEYLSLGDMGRVRLNAAMNEYELNYNQWKAEFDLLHAQMQSKWNAYNVKMQTMPAGTLTC